METLSPASGTYNYTHTHTHRELVQEMEEMLVPSLGSEDPMEEGMATHSSILAWRIPRTEEPGGLQSMGLQSQT